MSTVVRRTRVQHTAANAPDTERFAIMFCPDVINYPPSRGFGQVYPTLLIR